MKKHTYIHTGDTAYCTCITVAAVPLSNESICRTSTVNCSCNAHCPSLTTKYDKSWRQFAREHAQ